MPFNSYEFILVYLPFTFAGFGLLMRTAGSNVALWWIIFASIGFYAYGSPLGLVIIGSAILVNYVIALGLMRAESSGERFRKVIFVGGIVGNVLFLAYFKYWNFFLDTAGTLWSRHFDPVRMILPLGISFLTFQQIGFLIEMRAGLVRSINLRDYLLFASFFPRALAGPIVRYNDLIPQLPVATTRSITTDVVVGVCLFSIGLFKKTIVSDGIAVYVPAGFDSVLSATEAVSLVTAWVSVLAYTFQLYFDFSGYSDMALGAARLFGVRLPMNFNSPLKASSIIEFWARWHISLTRFLTAYIYTPVVLRFTRTRIAEGRAVLCGDRSSVSAITTLIVFPTLLTMAISGIWHGVGWQFAVWGVLHGVYLAVNQCWRLFRPRFWPDQVGYERVMKPLGFVLTFTAVVIGMVFFRAASLPSAFSLLGGMIGMNGVVPKLYADLGYDLGGYLASLALPLSWIGALFVVVVCMPNSLEIMQRFEPALNFSSRPTEEASSVNQLSVFNVPAEGAPKRLHAGPISDVLAGREGITLSNATAALVALVFVVAMVALSGSSAFLYFRF